jgi:hypothetical protein
MRSTCPYELKTFRPLSKPHLIYILRTVSINFNHFYLNSKMNFKDHLKVDFFKDVNFPKS